MTKSLKVLLLLPFTVFGFASLSYAAPDAETAYIFNSFSFLVHGFLVMLMAAGFCMLETGLVRAKNAVVQCAKNIGLYSIAGIMFAVVGYNLMYMMFKLDCCLIHMGPSDELKTFGGKTQPPSGSDYGFKWLVQPLL